MRPSVGGALAALLVLAGSPHAMAATGGSATTRVTYVSGGSVYLEAGRDQGVAAGDTAEARRNGQRIAGLLVREVTSRRAVCDTFATAAMPRIGDEARYRPHAKTTVVAERAAPDSGRAGRAASAGNAPARRRHARTWRGRVSLGYLGVDSDAGSRMRQPTLDLRLDRIGSALNLHADVRGRSTSLDQSTERQARVYRLAATWHDALSQRRLTVGRQVLSAAPGAAFFDGVVGEIDRGAWTLALFGGGEPEASTFEPSFAQTQAGGFARLRRGHAGRVWSATLGVLAARYRGETDRNAAFLDLFHVAPNRSIFFNQQIDANPSWKRALGDPAVSATSTFLFARQRVGPTVALQAGFDNRRSIRLARDRETAETAFDDRYRQGGWSGATWDPTPWLRLDGSGRWLSGVTAASRAYTGVLLLRTPRRHELALRLRATRTLGATDGRLEVVEGEWRFAGDRRLLIRAGREAFNDANGLTTTRSDWQGVELESGLGARIYGYASGEVRRGDSERSLQSQFGLSWFF